jgi:hypothetical protein
MVFINGVQFMDKPRSCYSCGFFFSGSTSYQQNPGKGHCTLFDEFHKSYISPPSRCAKLFNKAFKYSDGEKLVITVNLKNNDSVKNEI